MLGLRVGAFQSNAGSTDAVMSDGAASTNFVATRSTISNDSTGRCQRQVNDRPTTAPLETASYSEASHEIEYKTEVCFDTQNNAPPAANGVEAVMAAAIAAANASTGIRFIACFLP